MGPTEEAGGEVQAQRRWAAGPRSHSQPGMQVWLPGPGPAAPTPSQPSGLCCKVGPNGLPHPDLVPIPAWPGPRPGLNGTGMQYPGRGAPRARGGCLLLARPLPWRVASSGPTHSTQARPSAIFLVHLLP